MITPAYTEGMPTTKWETRRATDDELGRVAAVLARAFQDDPMWRWALGRDGTEERRARLDRFFGGIARVLHPRHRFGLVTEAHPEVRVLEQLGLEQLDRDLEADRLVLREEHLDHRAVPDRAQQPIAVADDVADVDLTAHLLGEAFGQLLELRDAMRDRRRLRRLHNAHALIVAYMAM